MTEREFIINSDSPQSIRAMEEAGYRELVRCGCCRYYTGGIDGYCDRWFRRTGGNMSFCNEADKKDEELTDR